MILNNTAPIHHLRFLFLFFGLFVIFSVLRHFSVFHQVDATVYHAAVQWSYSEVWLKLWHVITRLADGIVVYTLVALAVTVYAFLSGKWRVVLFVLFLVFLFQTGTWLKQLFAVERPVGLAAFYPEPGNYAYPSGHAIGSVVLFYFLPRFCRSLFGWTPLRGLFTRHAIVFGGVVLICLSRVFLGVHWLSDVVGGALWGAFISHTALGFYEKWFSLQGRDL